MQINYLSLSTNQKTEKNEIKQKQPNEVNNFNSNKIYFRGEWGKLQVHEHLPEIKQQYVEPLIKEIRKSFLGINVGINLKKLEDVFEGFGEIISELEIKYKNLLLENLSLKEKLSNSNIENNKLKAEIKELKKIKT